MHGTKVPLTKVSFSKNARCFQPEGARAPAQKPYTLTPKPQTVAGVPLKTERAART